MKLVLWLIVAANCHFINGLSVETTERVGRGAAEPLVSFNKLTAEENEERLEKCGKLLSLRDSKSNESVNIHPWISRGNGFSKENKHLDMLVLISKRHVLADGSILRHFNMTNLFGDYSNKPAQVLTSSNGEEIAKRMFLKECFTFKGSECEGIIIGFKPAKIMIDNFNNPKIVLFEIDVPMRVNRDAGDVPVCLPEWEIGRKEDVTIHVGINERTTADVIHNVHENGWTVVKSYQYTPQSPLTQLLFKETSGRIALVGNWPHYIRTRFSSIQIFSSVFQHTDLICEWTGVCPSLPRVEFNRLSPEENEERLRKCGRRIDAPKLSDAIELLRDGPWVANVRRSDNSFNSGEVISQRHIITYESMLSDLVIERYRVNTNRRNPSIISTGVPVKSESGKYIDFDVTVQTCVDDTCQSRKRVALHPTKIMLLPNGYLILEMSQNMNVLPACLPNDLYMNEISEDVFAVSVNGSRIRYKVTDDDEYDGTVLKVYSEDKGLGHPIMGSNYSPTLIHKRNIVFVAHAIHQHSVNESKEILSYRFWKTEQEAICIATGACSRRMVPVERRHGFRITTNNNVKRLSACGLSPNVLIDDGSLETPWLVGIRVNRNSPFIHTGVVISDIQILIDGSMFAEDALSELFGKHYKNQQPRVLDFEFPEYELPFKYNFEVLINRCNATGCSHQVMKPARLLVYDSSNPSLFVLELREYISNIPMCLEDRKEVNADVEVFTQQYTAPEASVLYVKNSSILAKPSLIESNILVRKKVIRHVLVGNRPFTAFSNSSNWFASMFSLRHKICKLTGACPPIPIPIQMQQISKQEDKERSETCGKLNPVHHHSASPKEPSIARDAPWIVGIFGPDTGVHTGVVISRRHVLMDISLFHEDTDIYEVFGGNYKDVKNSSLPMPRTSFELRVKVSVCEDDECRTAVEKELIPTKISKADYNDVWFLEFDEDLPVTPICIPDFEIMTNDKVFFQDYTDPKSLFDAITISRVDDGEYEELEYARTERVTYSRMIVKEANGRFLIVGHWGPTNRSGRSQLRPFKLFPIRWNICKMTGVCGTTSRTNREVLNKTTIWNEPKSSGTTERAEEEQ